MGAGKIGERAGLVARQLLHGVGDCCQIALTRVAIDLHDNSGDRVRQAGAHQCLVKLLIAQVDVLYRPPKPDAQFGGRLIGVRGPACN